MSDSLLLQLPRDRVTERGCGVTQRPADVVRRLTGAFAIDPLTGYATAPVTPSMANAWAWAVGGDEWLLSYPWILPDGTYGEGYSHRASTAFDVQSGDGPAAGAGFFFAFICYGGGSPFTLSCGTSTLVFDRGRVTWWHAGHEAARADLWHAEEWETAVHYLYVYAIGNRLAARRLGGGRPELDAGMLIETGAADAAAALPGGLLRVTGTGYLTFGAAPERHAAAAVVEHALIGLPEPSTQQPALTAQALLPTGATAEALILGPDGLEWDPGADPPYSGAGWRWTAALPAETGPNVYLTRLRLEFPPLVENDEVEPVDLATFTPAGLGGTGVIEQVELRRGPDPESCGLTLRLLTQAGDVSDYLQPHMRGRWSPGGTPWSEFFTSRPERAPYAPGTETLSVECESGWKLLKLSHWSGGPSYAGGTLAAAYRDVAERAGIAADEIEITTGGTLLPAEDADGEPLFDFQPGQSLADVLLYLRDQFGPDDVIRFKADGHLHIDAKPTAASGTVFVWETPAEEVAAIAAQTSTLARVLEWSERFDESELANDVWVVGRARDGSPLVAVATDWSSVRDPLARNYVAGFRQLLVVDAGLSTQGMVNQVAANLLAERRRARVTATLAGPAVAGLYEHDIVEVDGRGLWRVTSISVVWSSEARLGSAVYELEYHGEVPT